MRNYIVKENHIGSAVIKILIGTNRHLDKLNDTLLLYYKGEERNKRGEKEIKQG